MLLRLTAIESRRIRSTLDPHTVSLWKLIDFDVNTLGHPDDLHIFGDYLAAGHYGFFLVAVLQPHLTIQTFAVPAKVTVRDALHRYILETSEQRVVLGDHVFAAEYVDLD
jgi:hypothetical protein